ncbi:MAG: hypothetical protein J7K68_05080 [Candidatus Diapherotrites archaeon]|nr:hypothetical protein [Candidatus Diapherotrites archaeon]
MNILALGRTILFLIAMFIFLGVVSMRLKHYRRKLVSAFTYQIYVLSSVWAIIDAIVFSSEKLPLFKEVIPLLYFIISIGIFIITLRRMMSTGLL